MAQAHFTSTKRVDEGSKVTVHLPSGQLNGHTDCFNWLEEVRRDIQGGHSRVVLNLRDVAHIDSSGLGIVASIHVSATNAGGKLCLTGLGERQRLLFVTTWLFKVISTAEDEAQAIRVCAAPA